MREVQHAHHAENQRQACAEHEQQQAGTEAVQEVDEDLVQGDLLWVVERAKRSATWPLQPGRFIWQDVGVLDTYGS
jgi:hypothetical protein